MLFTRTTLVVLSTTLLLIGSRHDAAHAQEVGARPSEAAVDVIERVRQSVMQVVVQKSQSIGSGTAFLVSEDGFAITNAHVIEGGTSAEVELRGDKSRLKVELWAVQPGFDLALIRLPVNDSRVKGLRPLALAADNPRVGGDVWALGYPKTGFTVTRGVVNGIRDAASMNEFMKEHTRRLTGDPACTWIQTDCTINEGSSGGPLVDSHGTVVGINTWYFKGDSMNNTFFAVASSHAARLLTSRPESAVGYAAVQSNLKVRTTAVAPDDLQDIQRLPSIELPRTVPADEVRAAWVTLRTHLTCQVCSGGGKVTDQYRVEQPGPFGLPTSVRREQKIGCAKCAGTGVNDGDKIDLIASKALLKLARVRDGDPKLAACVEFVREVAQIPLNRSSQEFEQRLNSYSVGRGQRHSATDLSAIGAIGTLQFVLPGSTADEHVYLVDVVGNDPAVVALRAPLLAEAKIGSKVFVGGVVVGRVRTSSGTAILVERGVIVSP